MNTLGSAARSSLQRSSLSAVGREHMSSGGSLPEIRYEDAALNPVKIGKGVQGGGRAHFFK